MKVKILSAACGRRSKKQAQKKFSQYTANELVKMELLLRADSAPILPGNTCVFPAGFQAVGEWVSFTKRG
jgi:hypothetical protein